MAFQRFQLDISKATFDSRQCKYKQKNVIGKYMDLQYMQNGEAMGGRECKASVMMMEEDVSRWEEARRL